MVDLSEEVLGALPQRLAHAVQAAHREEGQQGAVQEQSEEAAALRLV